ncbi:MAG TPA: hypothetical protein PKM63_05350 [Panacibacter sp.]|nr:hypothetical protein [Panacibacter sp.]HNP43688.1 hypothetical protein [Panacibacter sp.]
MKYYRLLRNNKESGPFSSDDLISNGFKPYDLIWEEGKSAAWRYPSEIADFKNYAPQVEEQPFDRFYKKNKPAMQSKLPADQYITVAVTPKPSILAKEKPRIRIKADSTRIEMINPILPEEIKASSQPTTIELLNKETKVAKAQSSKAKPEWENMWLDWEEEKKAVQKLKFKSVPQTLSEPEVEIETKFSQSLDDVKQLYIEKVLNGKKAGWEFKQYKGYISIGVISLCVLAIGIWLGIQWTGDEETKAHLLEKNSTQSIVSRPVEEINAADNTNTTGEKTEKNDAGAVIIVPTAEKKPASTAQKTKPGTKASYVKANANSKLTPYANTNTVKQNKSIAAPAKQGVIKKEVVAGSGVVIKKRDDITIPAPEKTEKNIDSYIMLRSLGSSSPGASYRVENISDVALEMVMIDLQYYDAAGKFKKGETIYVRNINPGQSVSVKAPEDANASKITSRVSMISSEQNNLYLIAD